MYWLDYLFLRVVYFGILIIYQINSQQRFFPIVYIVFFDCWLFPLLCKNVLIWCIFQFCFCFVCYYIGVLFRKSLPMPVFWNVSHVFFVDSNFQVFYSFWVDFLFIFFSFCTGWEIWVWFQSYVDFQFSKPHLLKRLSSPIYVLCTFEM